MENDHVIIESKVSPEKSDKVTPKLPIWVILFTVVATLCFAYLTYTGGTYAGLIYAGAPGFDALGWGPLSAIFLFLVIVNPIGYLFTRRRIVSPQTMILLFVMLVSAANVTAVHPSLWLISLMGLPLQAASNPLAFQPLLEKFSSVVIPLGGGASFIGKNLDALLGFSSGQSTVPWGIWLLPLISWGLYILAFYFLGMGLATMVRKRWTDVERLRYPLIIPVIEMITVSDSDGQSLLGPIWKNKIMWCGFIPGLVIVLYAQLQEWYPALPQIPWAYGCICAFRPLYQGLQGTLLGNITARNAGFAIDYWGVSPLWLGVSYLIPAQETIIGYIVGYFFKLIPNYIFYTKGQMQSFPYTLLAMWDIFAFGAIFGLGAVVIYLSYRDIAAMFKDTFRKGKGDMGDYNEGLSYRTAVYMVCTSSLFIILFAILLMKYKVWLAFLYLAFYVLILLGYTRMRATSGLAIPGEVFGTNSLKISSMVIANFVGEKNVGLMGLTGMSVLAQHDRNSRNLMMGNLLEGWKLAEGENIPKRLITKAMTIAFTIGLVIFYFTALNFIYKGNGVTTAPRGAYAEVDYRWLAPLSLGRPLNGPNTSVIKFFSAGVLAILFISFMRLRFVWWPIEPTGFAWGSIYGYIIIVNFIIVGILKIFIFRYGGNKLYNRLRPIFLGLIIGSAMGNIIINMAGIFMAL